MQSEKQSERNWVGEIILEYSFANALVHLEIDEIGSTFLTMDQVDSLATILRRWVEKYQHIELEKRP